MGHTRRAGEGMEKVINHIRKWNMTLPGEAAFGPTALEEADLEEIAKHIQTPAPSRPRSRRVDFVKGALEARDPCPTDQAEIIRARLLEEYAGTVFKDHTGGDPKVR